MEMTFDEAARIVRVQSYLLNAQIEMNAMIAENQHRAHVGEGIAYGEDTFLGLIGKHCIGFNDIQSELYPQDR